MTESKAPAVVHPPSMLRGDIDDPKLAAALRTLELTVKQKLDGVLHGDHLGLIPGPGSEPGESRLYQPGDDVRRMDWAVTARTTHPHVRQMIADRELETWLVVDMSASLDFGTACCEKRDLAVAAAGCGRIVLNSRSTPSPHATRVIERLRAAGADIQVECGDIADAATAHRVVAVATASGLPVRGVLHAAAVVEDATLANVTDELIDRCWAPKVHGAWNIHRATAAQPLEWFCLFSSAAALVGSPGQGAYAAANSWLDAFAHWRRAQGLPATSIAWGAWAEIGRATALAEGTGAAIAPAEGARAFQTLLRYGRAYSGYAPIMGTPWLTAFAQRSRFAEAFHATGQNQPATGKFLAELGSLPREEWPRTVRRLVSDQISLLLRRTIDPDRPLSDYGLDSLGNLELRTRIETETGIRVSPTKITTVRGLAEHVCDELAAAQSAPV